MYLIRVGRIVFNGNHVQDFLLDGKTKVLTVTFTNGKSRKFKKNGEKAWAKLKSMCAASVYSGSR